ncbi:hypothetical protein KY290_023163 [Solanum tuberosum]|uniref:Uncharacterized protein n=1 Tax=Solanum tuberosum TaxID=4113 RepID=A0ABQ7V9I5_SOLTU|nr:hypothetical protein KY284_022061 [Solanum tuberosum]KAH0683002.1 hypothetical protein KY289_020754 [Solanum tuberosum]KAH0694832.1 hypothetical protein KY285_021929 [Solanum tuberosum]KAH0759670.1 hypothetical protein KY290_023163 [Solanum tuberosum]
MVQKNSRQRLKRQCLRLSARARGRIYSQVNELQRTRLPSILNYVCANNEKEVIILAGIHNQKGYRFIDLYIPVTYVEADDMNDLARLADEYGSGEIWFTGIEHYY